MSGIPEAKNYAGFPVGGQFLAFKEPAVAERHKVKVYGMADAGSPPMSVPHIDSRKLDDKSVVLFGPFARFSTKFLKNGSWFDLFSSVNHENVAGMLKVAVPRPGEVSAGAGRLTDADRHAELLKYYPNAKREDWQLVTAGQRVQIIKRDPEKGAILQFGTEIVTDQDKTIAVLLEASPGASTAPSIMLNLLAQASRGKWPRNGRQSEGHRSVLRMQDQRQRGPDQRNPRHDEPGAGPAVPGRSAGFAGRCCGQACGVRLRLPGQRSHAMPIPKCKRFK